MEQKTKQKKNKARHWENKKKNKNKYPNPWIHSSSTYGIFLWSQFVPGEFQDNWIDGRREAITLPEMRGK